jgi:hypothetical protein
MSLFYVSPHFGQYHVLSYSAKSSFFVSVAMASLEYGKKRLTLMKVLLYSSAFQLLVNARFKNHRKRLEKCLFCYFRQYFCVGESQASRARTARSEACGACQRHATKHEAQPSNGEQSATHFFDEISVPYIEWDAYHR